MKKVKRVVKNHNVRKDEILDSAKKMFFTYGYEQTTVEKVIDDIHIAKGTFYHYFRSKLELLEVLAEREISKNVEIVKRIRKQDDLNALEKFNTIINHINSWKVTNKTFYKLMFSVMYEDNNLIVRNKFMQFSIKLFVPEYSKIIEQGMDEGIFHCDDTVLSAEFFLLIGDRLREKLAKIYTGKTDKIKLKQMIISHVSAYEKIVERILGLKKGNIILLNRDLLKGV